MRYESELLGLMSMLKSYLTKVKSKYDGLVDMDDLYQECMLNAVKSSDNQSIKDPVEYFKGVFKKTVVSVSSKKIREFQYMNNIEVKETWEDHETGLIEAIDMRVKSMKPVTRRVWSCLKTFYGDRNMVSKALGSYGQRIDYHKNKLKKVYYHVIEN